MNHPEEPSPQPSPVPNGRGGILGCAMVNPTRTDWLQRGTCFSLSLATLAHRMGEGLV